MCKDFARLSLVAITTLLFPDCAQAILPMSRSSIPSKYWKIPQFQNLISKQKCNLASLLRESRFYNYPLGPLNFFRFLVTSWVLQLPELMSPQCCFSSNTCGKECRGGGCGARAQELACSLLALYETGLIFWLFCLFSKVDSSPLHPCYIMM